MSQDVKAGGKSLWPIPTPPVSNRLRLKLSISFNFPVDETNGSIHENSIHRFLDDCESQLWESHPPLSCLSILCCTTVAWRWTTSLCCTFSDLPLVSPKFSDGLLSDHMVHVAQYTHSTAVRSLLHVV